MVNSQWLIVILKWLPPVFWWGIFIVALFLYFNSRKSDLPNIDNNFKRSDLLTLINYKLLIISSIVFRFFYAALLTASQYYVWSQNKFTELLLNSPLDPNMSVPSVISGFCQLSIVNCQKSGYFFFYSYGRFWLNVLISIGAAFIFYLLLKLLEKYRDRFFEEGETKLGFLAALIVGWPNFIVFLPLVFIFVILFSIFRRILLKELYTTLGWPFILAALITLIWGSKLMEILNLSALKI